MTDQTPTDVTVAVIAEAHRQLDAYAAAARRLADVEADPNPDPADVDSARTSWDLARHAMAHAEYAIVKTAERLADTR